MTFPTIEELVAPHLARLRSEAETKVGSRVRRVDLWFRDGADATHQYVALVRLQNDRDYTNSGDTIDEAIHNLVAIIPAPPNLAAILGYEDGRP